jgi:hypothetical protein
MNRIVATVGLILLLLAGFLFYVVFEGGVFLGFIITGTNSVANFIAFLFVILALPIGSGLMFYGFAFRKPILAAGTGQVIYRSGGRGLGAAALVIAIIMGSAALGFSISTYNSNSQLSTNYSNLNGKVSSLGTQIGAVNTPPTVVPIKIQWCNPNTLQDRFCPGNIVVVQGDIVQIFFIQNDTADHTFTIVTPYNFQINDSGAGELNFLTNYSPVAGNCSNSGTFAQISAGVSGIYCVSGTSLLSNATLVANGANNFRVAQNPNPGLPFTPSPGEIVAGEPAGVNLTNPGPELYPVNDQVEMISLSVTGVGVNATGVSETQGIGAFWATTPGVFEFFCHYHVANGMYGYLTVLPNAYCTTKPASCGLNSTASS